MKYLPIITSLLIISVSSISHADTPLYKQTTSSFAISNYAKTQYPIVFAHGVFGFGRLFGVADYWYQILPDLARNGGNVWTTQVSPLNSSEVRGEAALAQAQDILAITGAKKLNLVGHSHGGHTVRYIAGIIPNQIASVTTVASPNQGAKLGDFLEKVLLNNPVEAPARAIFDQLVGPVIAIASGKDPKKFPYDAKAALQSLNTKQALEFNKKFPNGVPTRSCGEGQYQVNGTYYYSFMGNSAFNTVLDPGDYFILLASKFGDGDGDGVAPRCSSRFGRVLKEDYRWNHFDEVNHVLGIRSIFAADPVSVYRQHANRLKLQGL